METRKEDFVDELLKIGFKPDHNGYTRLIGQCGIEFYLTKDSVLILKDLFGNRAMYKDVDSIYKVNKAQADFYNNK